MLTAGIFFETPASLACIYQLVPIEVPGCNPNVVTTNVAKGSKAIAIVDAFHYPGALGDLRTFSSQFGLPAPTSSSFEVVYATGTRPPDGTGSGWDVEAALDIQYAHGLAPNAKVYLVEAASDSFSDLFQAVDKATQLVATAGGGEVSMSWGGAEFSTETSFDSHMAAKKVVYFAASGDSVGTIYPCVSPNVVCVGGTGNSRNPVTGKFEGEIAWANTGGGLSLYETRPPYQEPIRGIVHGKRGVPDIAAVADPNTGVWIFNAANGGWFPVGGTSVATPVMAAIANLAGHFYASSATELNTIYSTIGGIGPSWNDITSGACGPYDGFLALQGWDFCTGVGTPRASSSKWAY
jgi:subtilase family serine protease